MSFVAGAAKAEIEWLVAEYAISERTAWRWRQRLLDEDDDFELDAGCRFCGEPLPDEATSRRRFCDDMCRQYYRRRHGISLRGVLLEAQ